MYCLTFLNSDNAYTSIVKAINNPHNEENRNEKIDTDKKISRNRNKGSR